MAGAYPARLVLLFLLLRVAAAHGDGLAVLVDVHLIGRKTGRI